MPRHVPVIHRGGLAESQAGLIKSSPVSTSLRCSVVFAEETYTVRAMCRIMATHKRILSTLGNGPARRNLFGPVDREQLQAEYQASLRKDLEEASTRWGFDFILDKPLESSDFQWEGIPGAKVPLLYRSCMFDLGQEKGQRVTEAAVTPKRGRVEPPPQREKENIPCSPKRCELDLENLEKTPEKGENTGLKRKQTNLTDFYQAKRRVVWLPRKSGE